LEVGSKVRLAKLHFNLPILGEPNKNQMFYHTNKPCIFIP